MIETSMRKQLETILLAEITELNGEITEEGLNMAIMESIIEERVKDAQINRESLVVERLYSEQDTENIEANGVFVYRANNIQDFVFNRHNTVADAVREAVKMINASVICDGEVMQYDTLDNETAYYIDNRVSKVMIVNL